MKYVITGASTYGVRNMGDDAMFANMVQGLHANDPEAEIIFLARHPDVEYDKLFNIHSIKNLDHDSNEAAAGRMFFGFNSGDDQANIRNIKYHIDSADLLIIGGNSFMEISLNNFMRGVSSYSTTLAILAKYCGTPYALYGLNIVDPVKNLTTREHAKFLCENAISVTVREPEVLTYLQDMDIGLGNVEVCGDPAFGMEGKYDKDFALNLLEKHNIKLSEKKELLSISYRLEYWKNDERQFSVLADGIASLIDALVKKYNFQVLFIPNCTYTYGNKWEDDRLVNELIQSKLKTKTDIFFITDELDVYETFSIFSLTNLHISNRRHSNAFAAMHGKPFLSMSVSLATHMSALLKSLKHPELEIDLTSPIEKSIWKIDQVLSRKNEISRKLKNETTRLKKLAQQHIPKIIQKLEALM